MFDDSQISQPNVTNDPAQAPASAAANPPSTPASPSTPPVQPPLGASDAQPTAPGDSSVPAQNLNPSARPTQDQVSNTQPPVAQEPHPAVKRASVLYEVAQALAGGPRYEERIDDSGNRVKTPVKMSGRSIAMAIALEAISGSLTGLAAGRGHGAGAAGAAAMQQSMQRRQQEQQRQDQQAQDDFNNRSKALASKANLAELNARIGLNVAETEKIGSEMIDKQVELNRSSGVLDTDPSNLENGGQPLTQQEILDGMRTGKFNVGSHIGAMAGRVPATSKDGSTHWEATFLLVKNPNAPVTLSQEQWDAYSSAHVPGFPAGVKVGQNGMELKLSQVQRANEIMAAHNLADYRLKDMRDVLESTPYADRVPASIDFSKPGVESAMTRFQKYVSHSAAHGMDVLESLQAMGTDKRDPRTGAMQPNPDAKYVDTIANAMGGWPVLEAVHNKLVADKKTAEKQAEADVDIKKERALIPIKAATAKAEAQAKASVAATSSKNDDGSWNMGSIPVQLVEGGMDPSQLSKRSADYNQKLEAASAYSLAKYGKPFDIAQATTDYKQANNPQVQSMLKMVGAMSAPNGELAIAINAAKALPQLNSSLVNKVFNITETQFGSPAATNFHTAMIGFSDLYAKVMGGGVGTDALRQSAMDVLKDGYSRGQIAGSISVLQQQIEARKSQMIGANPYLRKQFGATEQQQNSNNVQAPPASALKEGVATKFANGQTWTLRGGQPVQVQ